MFSRRLPWDQPANQLSRLLAEKRSAAAEILDLTESNPTRAGFDYPSAGILAALADPASLRYDPEPRGLAPARQAVCRYYAARSARIHESQVLIAASTSESYSFLFKLLADPDAEILAPRPSYPLFEYLAALESVVMRQYPLRYDGAWHIDFPALERAVTPRTRAVVVVNPNNPTGSFLKRGELDRLDALALRHDLAILSDEVFSDYGFGQDPDRVDTLVGRAQALTFSLGGLSKCAGLPQLKLGWIVAGGHRAADACERLELIADTYLSVGTPAQVGLGRILAAAQTIQRQIRERASANLDLIRRALAGSAAAVLHAEGGWYAVIRMPRTRSEEEWALALLRDSNVLLEPGYFFDFEEEAYLVASLLTQPPAFAEGIQRLRRAAR